MKVLMVCTDELTIYFDKRVLDLAQVLKEDGHEVSIFTIGRTTKLRMDINPAIFQFSRTSQVISSFIKSSGVNHEQITNFPGTSFDYFLQNLSSFARRILPTKFKTHARRIVSRLIKVRRYLDWRRKTELRSDATYDFYEVDAGHLIENLRDNDADVILGCDLPGAIAAMGLKRENQVFWYDAHEYYSEQGWIQDRVNMERLRFWESLIINSCDALTTVSFGLAELYRSRFPKVSCIGVLTNASNPKRLKNSSQTNLRLKLGIQDDEKICIYHGGLSGVHRNLENFVDLFLKTNSHDWHLVLLGYNASNFLERISATSNRVHLMNEVPNDQVGSILGECDCIAMPYLIADINTLFGFPNKLGDALALNIPFIYNEDLKEIGSHAKEFKIGLPFLYGTNQIESIDEALNSVSQIESLWQEASDAIGWDSFLRNTRQVMSYLEERNSYSQKTT
jgi:hypothetical protein